MKSKELKKEALSKISGKFQKLVLIQLMYTLFTIAFNFLINFLNGRTNSSTIVSFILSLVYLLLSFPFAFGVLSSIVNISRGKDSSITDFINIGLKKFGSYWKVAFRLFFKVLLPLIVSAVIIAVVTGIIVAQSVPNVNDLVNNLIIMVLVFYILLFISMVIILLPYVLTSFVLHDNPEKTSKEILQISAELMQKNKLRYIGLLFSFIGWYLLSALFSYLVSLFLPETLAIIVGYIPSLFLTPYVTITQLAFYENLKANTNISKEAENVENTEEPVQNNE